MESRAWFYTIEYDVPNVENIRVVVGVGERTTLTNIEHCLTYETFFY